MFCRSVLVSFILLSVVGSGWAFQLPQPRPSVVSSGGTVTAYRQRIAFVLVTAAAKKKGFGNVPEPPKKKQLVAVQSETMEKNIASATGTPTTGSTTSVSTSKSEPPAQQQQQQLNPGQIALEQMRRQRAEQKDQELRKVRELLSTDQQVQETPAAIPEKVAQRMGQRMLPFVGIPLLGGMGSFVAFWYLATYKNMEIQPAMVATATVFFLVVGLLGITYSVLSASWDESREGDLLGAEEFKNNIDNIKEGLSRSRQNALLRERMAGLSEEELQEALTDLERRENAAEAKKRKQATLQEKLMDDLE